MINTTFGLSILRIISCFCVVLIHFCGKENLQGNSNITIFNIVKQIFYYIYPTAVPIFMILSFYFFSKILNEQDNEKFKDRMKRLIIPQVFWTIVYAIVFKVLFITTANWTKNPNISDFLYQFFLGHSQNINETMWFQVDLIILTLLYFLIFRFMKREKAIICICVLAITSIFLQYSGINYNTFKDLINETRYPLGRIAEVIPYCTIRIPFKFIR